jgi:hypothetical protein
MFDVVTAAIAGAAVPSTDPIATAAAWKILFARIQPPMFVVPRTPGGSIVDHQMPLHTACPRSGATMPAMVQ